MNRCPTFCGPEKSSKGSFVFPPWLLPVKTPLSISTIQAKPEPLNPAIGNCVPCKACLASVVIFPFLLRATPKGIFKPNFSALRILPRLIIEAEESNIKGVLPVGAPKQIGLVPNKDFFAPCGANAGGALVKQNTNKFFFTACSA